MEYKDQLIGGIESFSSRKVPTSEANFLEHYEGVKWAPKFIMDKSPQILLMGGRRGSKTTNVSAKIAFTDLFYRQEMVDTFIFYASKTFEHAKSLMWEKLRAIKDYFDLDDWNMKNESDGIIVTPRCQIKMLGFNDIDSIGKALGQPFKMFAIDECQEIRSDILKTVVRDAAAWGAMDASGSVILCGNPCRFKYHFWSQEWLHGNCPKYKTNLYENPFMSNFQKEKWLEDQRKIRREEKGQESPEFRRMAYGDLVFESSNNVFNITEKNYYKTAPQHLEKVIGVDLGWKRYDAIVVLGWHKGVGEEFGKIYLLEEHQAKGQSFEGLAMVVDSLAEKHSVNTIVLDTGGLAVKSVPDLNSRYSKRQWIPANKSEKVAWIKLLQTEIIQERFFMPQDCQFEKEASLVEWEEHSDKLNEKMHKSDILDAVLYATRYCHTNLREEVTDGTVVNINKWPDYKRKLAEGRSSEDGIWSVSSDSEW